MASFWFTLTLLLVCALPYVFSYQWTEEDESKRIAELKREEQRMFIKQTGRGTFVPKSNSAEFTFDYNLDYSAQMAPMKSQFGRRNSILAQPVEEAVQPSPWHTIQMPSTQHNEHNNSHHKHHLHHHHHHVKKHWCFHCISPWHTVSSDMRQVVLNLLELRRAKPPSSQSVVADCTQPRVLDSLPRQTCKHSYCQTLVLTDHDAGTAFTLRGCAENFGAIDEKLLEDRGDNTCKKLHDRVDIQECICKHRKYCHTGPDRVLDYTENIDDFQQENEGTARHMKVERHVLRNGVNSFQLYRFNCFYCIVLSIFLIGFLI